MVEVIVPSDGDNAGKLWGVRICAVLVSLGAIASVVCCVLAGMAVFFQASQHARANSVKSFFVLVCFISLTYALLRISTGLLQGRRFAQLGGIAWGVLLLLFCWMLVHDARGPYNPKAPDAQELDGPMFLLMAPTALWLIGYLCRKRVSAKFLNLPIEEIPLASSVGDLK